MVVYGMDGVQGVCGCDGLSTYEAAFPWLWVRSMGTEHEWVAKELYPG